MKNRTCWILPQLILFVFFVIGPSDLIAKQLSLESFAKLPDVTKLRLSPNGKKVASLVRYERKGVRGVLLYVLDIDTMSGSILAASDNEKYLINKIDWAGDEAVLITLVYPSHIHGTKVIRTSMMRYELGGGSPKSVVPISFMKKMNYQPTNQSRVVDYLPNEPDEIMLSLRTTGEVASKVYRINHKKGKTKRITHQREKTLNWVTDQQNNVRLAKYFFKTTTRYDHRFVGSKKWTPLFEFESFDGQHRYPLGFGKNPNILFYTALHEGRDAVFKTDLSIQPLVPELVFADERFDVNGSLVYSHKTKEVVGIEHGIGIGYSFWDEEYSNLLASVRKALPKSNNKLIEISQDARKIIVLATTDIDAGSYYLWDRDSGKMSILAYRYNALDPDLMAAKQSISYTARDGLEIQGYLTRPNDYSEQPAPSIIFPHGGPQGQTGDGFDYWAQFFAYRGYNVLQMNFRGSTGYGFDFMASGLKDWGGKMQTDVEDGTRWLIEQGVADPKRICIVGASYGGYAALMEAANGSKLYQCAVSFAGVTDLPKLKNYFRKYIGYNVFSEQVGEDKSKLKTTSPSNRVNEINIPVLLAHGSKDYRVPISQAKIMHKRLRKAGKEVELVELEDGNHYLSNEENRIQFFRAMDRFLTQHLN